jgi:L-fucose isomerase
MICPKVGLLVFSESLAREDVYRKRKPIADREVQRFVSALGNEVELVWPSVREIRSKRQAMTAVRELEAAAVDAVVLYVAIFVSPAVVAHTANLLRVPCVLACNEAEDSISQLAFLASSGAIQQIGTPCCRIAGDAAEPVHRSRLLHFLRAAAAMQQLRGQTFGCIGGRSLGISTGTADLSLWERIFNVDIEHVDQHELYDRAQHIDPNIVDRHVQWLKEKAVVQFNESTFTKTHLEKQIRSYLALKDIVAAYEMDFVGVKCQTEMSNRYCLQCVNVALCNDPYDADGAKEPVCCSCEADSDGALTMQILKLLSGGKPTSLNDLVQITDTSMVLANCGAMASYFTQLSENADDNLGALTVGPHNFGEAGGGSTQFVVPAGIEMTFARLFHQKDGYSLGVMTGTTEAKTVAEDSALRVRPLIFARIDIDKIRFLETFGSNHLLAVEGHLKDELSMLADLLEIKYIDYDHAR